MVEQSSAVDKADDSRDQIRLLSMKVEQHSVNLLVEAQKREALGAELRQSLTETRFELRALQQSRAKAIEAIKAVKERCQQLHSQYVGHEASIVGLRRDVDRLLDGMLTPSRMNAPQSSKGSSLAWPLFLSHLRGPTPLILCFGCVSLFLTL